MLILDDVAASPSSSVELRNKGNGEIYRKKDGTLWTTETLGQACKRVAKKVGIPFTPYVLRHSAASNLLMASRDAVTMAAILGHTDVNMLSNGYGHLDKQPEHLKQLLDDANGRQFVSQYFQ